MAKTKISEFSTTPGNNTDINGINIAEGCAPSGINNAIRELMSDLKEWQSGAMDVYVIPQGTAAAPGIQLYGDLDTGLYGYAANQLGVAVGGASAGYFSSDGWVGNVVATTVDLTNIEVTNIKAKDGTAAITIADSTGVVSVSTTLDLTTVEVTNIKAKDGTTSISLADSTGIATFSKATVIETTDNTNAALRITQLGTGNALLVEDATSPDATPTVIDQFGNIILGKETRTTPVTSKFEIHSTSTESQGLTPSLGFYNWSATASSASHLTFRHYPSGTVGTLAANTSGDVLGRVVFLSYDGTNAFSASIIGVSGTGGASPSISYAAAGGHNFSSGVVSVSTQLNADNLRLDGNTISSTDTDGNIVISPNGTGDVQLDADTVRVGDSNANATITSNGTADLILNTNSGTNSGSITIQDGVNGNIIIAPNGTGQVQITNAALDLTTIEVSNINAKDGTAAITIADSTGAVGISTAVTMSATTQNIALGTSQTTGTFTVGGAAQTGALTLDQSTKTHTLNLGTGATESGLTKTINIGTAGVSGSTTAINIGSANGTTTTLNGTVTAATLNSTTIDTTNIEVTNIKAKDGTAALSIADSTGAVTVATALTANGGAVFNENGADVDFRVEGDTDANLIFADASTDRVGIGTNAPTEKLEVSGNAAVTGVGYLALQRPLIPVGQNGTGSLDFRWYSTGTTYTTGASISATSEAAWASTSAPARLEFLTTASGSTTPTIRMTLNSSGNLGLGVTPSAYNNRGFDISSLVGLSQNSAGAATLAFNNFQNSAGNYIYKTTNAAARYDCGNEGIGRHAWFIAGSGTAGNTISFTQAMTLDASGNLGIGQTNPSTWLVNGLGIGSGANDWGATIYTGTASTGYLCFADGATGLDRYRGYISYAHATNAMIFGTDATERARITSGGYFKASNNAAYVGSTDPYHELNTNAADWTAFVRNTNATTPYGLRVFFSGATPNGTGSQFFYCSDSTALRAEIRSNGGIANYSANNVALSDQRVKKDIVAAPSYWDKIKGIEIVLFKYKDQTHDDNNVGVIAQQVEQVAPEFVDPDGWGETPEDGVPLKSIYTSDMYHAAIKALQEAMARIEKLEAEVAALKGV